MKKLVLIAVSLASFASPAFANEYKDKVCEGFKQTVVQKYLDTEEYIDYQNERIARINRHEHELRAAGFFGKNLGKRYDNLMELNDAQASIREAMASRNNVIHVTESVCGTAFWRDALKKEMVKN